MIRKPERRRTRPQPKKPTIPPQMIAELRRMADDILSDERTRGWMDATAIAHDAIDEIMDAAERHHRPSVAACGVMKFASHYPELFEKCLSVYKGIRELRDSESAGSGQQSDLREPATDH